MDDKIFYNALAQINLIGPRRFKKLINFFKTAEAVWQADFGLLIKAGLDHKTTEVVATKRRRIDPEKEWEKLIKADIKLITPADQSYPQKLKELYDLPQVLYVKGELRAEDDFSVAIVGTRKISSYGKQITPRIAQELAEENITIVSGLALGIDALAHTAAIEAGGKTIGLLRDRGLGRGQRHDYRIIQKDFGP